MAFATEQEREYAAAASRLDIDTWGRGYVLPLASVIFADPRSWTNERNKPGTLRGYAPAWGAGVARDVLALTGNLDSGVRE